MTPLTLSMRFRSWLAGLLFTFAGRLDSAYDVWLDDAPRREPTRMTGRRAVPDTEKGAEQVARSAQDADTRGGGQR